MLNNSIRGMCNAYNYTVINSHRYFANQDGSPKEHMYYDLIHLNNKGTKVLTDILRSYIIPQSVKPRSEARPTVNHRQSNMAGSNSSGPERSRDYQHTSTQFSSDEHVITPRPGDNSGYINQSQPSNAGLGTQGSHDYPHNRPNSVGQSVNSLHSSNNYNSGNMANFTGNTHSVNETRAVNSGYMGHPVSVAPPLSYTQQMPMPVGTQPPLSPFNLGYNSMSPTHPALWQSHTPFHPWMNQGLYQWRGY